MSRRIALAAASCLFLQGCWVPQVIQGVRPEIFPSAAASAGPDTQLTLESKIVAMGTRLIALSKRSSSQIALSSGIAAHRQNLENKFFYNTKAAGDFTTDWTLSGGTYHYYDGATASRYSLDMVNNSGGNTGFDASSFFPEDVKSYNLLLENTDVQSARTLKQSLRAVWPVQIPLRGSFITTLSGSGEDTGPGSYGKLGLRVDGKSSSDASLVEGQLSFSAEIDGRIYNGFGTLDALGFVGDVHIEQNGVSVAQIQRKDKRWDVVINERVLASGN